LNPSPYLFYLQLNDGSVVASSQECPRQSSGRDFSTRPIAGTRWARQGRPKTIALERECLASEKSGHHLILRRAGRNDLGRVWRLTAR